jgi:hypothetical protein
MSAPPDPIFFTDRDLGRRFPKLLLDAGLMVERHDTHFEPITPDEVWLPEIHRRGWTAVTRDGRIRYSPLALEAMMKAGTQLLVIVGKLTNDEAAAVFIRHEQRIRSMLASEKEGFIAKIRRDGIFMWLRHARWKREHERRNR